MLQAFVRRLGNGVGAAWRALRKPALRQAQEAIAVLLVNGTEQRSGTVRPVLHPQLSACESCNLAGRHTSMDGGQGGRLGDLCVRGCNCQSGLQEASVL